jgi:hypothetical protein
MMDSFLGDYYSHRCSSGRKSGDVFNDYLDIKKGVPLSKPSWRLHKIATIVGTKIGKGTWNGISVDVTNTMTSLVAMMGMVLLTGVWTLK